MTRALLLAVVGAFVAPAALATHAGPDFVHDGYVLYAETRAGVSTTTWILTGERLVDRWDGEVVDLPSWAAGHWMTVYGTRPPYGFDAQFFDADRVLVWYHGCATQAAWEACLVPPGSAYALVEGTCCFTTSVVFQEPVKREDFRLTVHATPPPEAQ